MNIICLIYYITYCAILNYNLQLLLSSFEIINNTKTIIILSVLLEIIIINNKLSVGRHNVLPVVMGGRREDYERMAPRRSYLHVDDYESPKQLAEYLKQLDANDDLYNEYFRWKGTGEFIDTKFFCRLCALLHDDDAPTKHYRDLDRWWRPPNVCDHSTKWLKPPPVE